MTETTRSQRRWDRRRLADVCINNLSHGAPYRGGRCKLCWDKKLAAERAAYRRRTS